MQVGDLVMTHNGNLVIITDIGEDWANILFCESNHHRTGFPTVWLRGLKCK